MHINLLAVIFLFERFKTPTIVTTIEGPAILKEEVENALKTMKQGKAKGPDDIPTEVIIALEDLGIIETTKLMNNIYDTGEIPEDMKKSVFIALPKKQALRIANSTER